MGTVLLQERFQPIPVLSDHFCTDIVGHNRRGTEMEGIAADRDRCHFLAGDAGHSAFASSGMEGNPADDADLAGVAGTCAAAEHAMAGRRYRLFLVPPSGICYSDFTDYVLQRRNGYGKSVCQRQCPHGMLILGLKDRNLGVNVSDRKNAIQAAQFLKTKNPRLTLMDIEEKKVSLTEIHTE